MAGEEPVISVDMVAEALLVVVTVGAVVREVEGAAEAMVLLLVLAVVVLSVTIVGESVIWLGNVINKVVEGALAVGAGDTGVATDTLVVAVVVVVVVECAIIVGRKGILRGIALTFRIFELGCPSEMGL